MEIFEEELRLSIHNILSPVSEETVNEVCHAIENAGFKSLSDLHRVRERDLMFVLKPFDQEKLIKAWNEPGMIEEVKWEYERKKNEDISQQIDDFLAQARYSSEANMNQGILFPPSNISDVYKPILVDNMNKDSSVALSLSSTNASFSISNIPVLSGKRASVERNYSYTSESPFKKFCPNTNQTFDSFRSELPHRNSVLTHQAPFPSELATGVTCSSYKSISPVKSSNLPSTYCRWTRKNYLLLLETCVKYNEFLSCPNSREKNPEVWEKITEEVRKKCSIDCNKLQVMDKIEELRLEYHKLKNETRIGNKRKKFLNVARNVFETSENSDILPVKSSNLKSTYSRWTRKNCLLLLEKYVKYKRFLSCPNSREKNPEIWGKITEEVCEKCSIYCNKLEVMDKIEELRLKYHKLKNEETLTLISGKKRKFFNKARNAFETTENSATSFGRSSNCASTPSFKWFPNRRIALLRLYAKYKTNLSSASEYEESIWMEIAEEVGKNNPHCDAELCRNEVHVMKSEYKSMKNNKPYESKLSQAVFLDEAENAFDNSKPFVVPAKDLGKWIMRKADIVNLLQVYAKYQEELLLQNFDVQMQIVWEKVAKEVTKMCSLYYGKRRCCYEIHHLKHLYETLKVRDGKKPYFFYEARKIFESTKCTATTFTKLSRNGSSPILTWSWRRRLALLRLYTLFKTELSYSNIDEQKVWKMIAQKVKKQIWSNTKIDGEECYRQLRKMKCEYEAQKHNKPYEFISNQLIQVVFLDEAENAFEVLENPVSFSVTSKLTKWAMSKADRITLLQVYGKYKDKLLLQNFDVEKQVVWGKVAREVTEKCSSFYGKRRCCYEINNFKFRYEEFMQNEAENVEIPYFLDEAKKVFELSECPVQNGEGITLKNPTIKQEK